MASSLSTPDAPDYATAREVYNAGIVTQPKVIACCTSETGVQHALERANAENWPVAVKAGGHSFEGFCLNDDGLVVSVSPMREIQFDAKTGILTAGAGCRLEEVNRFLLAREQSVSRVLHLVAATECSPENGV
jgi:FAD/FMN-containing dehydrogenase